MAVVRDGLRRAASDARLAAVAWAGRNRVSAMAFGTCLMVPVAVYLVFLQLVIVALVVACSFVVLVLEAIQRRVDDFVNQIPDALVASWMPFDFLIILWFMSRVDLAEDTYLGNFDCLGWYLLAAMVSVMCVSAMFAGRPEFSQLSVDAVYHSLLIAVLALVALSVFVDFLSFFAVCFIPALLVVAWDGGLFWRIKVEAARFFIGRFPMQFVPTILAVDGDDRVSPVTDEEGIRSAVLHGSALRHPVTGTVAVDAYVREHGRNLDRYVRGNWRRNRAEKVLGREVRALKRRERRVSGWRVLR